MHENIKIKCTLEGRLSSAKGMFMYVHIGNNEILNKDDVVAILDIKTITMSRQNLRIINKLKERNDPADQSVIIIQRGNKEENIFTNIAASTLRKRLEMDLEEMFS